MREQTTGTSIGNTWNEMSMWCILLTCSSDLLTDLFFCGIHTVYDRSIDSAHKCHSSVQLTYGQEQYSLTEIYQKYGTSGVPYFAGRRQRDHSFVPENSYGRKVTRFMQHMKRLNKEQSRCGRFTKISTKRQWLYHL